MKGQSLWIPVDIAAKSIWADLQWLENNGGPLECGDAGASAADGHEIEILGQGKLSFRLWECFFKELVRVVRTLPTKVSIGTRFWREHALRMDLEMNQVKDGSSVCEELVRKVIEESEVDQYILSEIDVSQFSSDAVMQKRLTDLIWKHRDIFKGFACIRGVQEKIKVKLGTEPIYFPSRRRSPKEEEVE